jgi:hypothetical protein
MIYRIHLVTPMDTRPWKLRILSTLSVNKSMSKWMPMLQTWTSAPKCSTISDRMRARIEVWCHGEQSEDEGENLRSGTILRVRTEVWCCDEYSEEEGGNLRSQMTIPNCGQTSSGRVLECGHGGVTPEEDVWCKAGSHFSLKRIFVRIQHETEEPCLNW